MFLITTIGNKNKKKYGKACKDNFVPATQRSEKYE
jgi:hypothetical protein